MGLFGGNDGEAELQELRDQLDDIQRRQNSTPPSYGQLPDPGGSFGLDMEGPMQLKQSGVRVSPFTNADAGTIDLETILKQAQAPVPGQGALASGMPQLPGQGPRNGVEDDDLMAALLQMGGMPEQR
jgi:hypothetical protein